MTGPLTTVTLTHDRLERLYVLREPAMGADRLPLVVQLHGRGIPPHLFDRWTGFGTLADAEGFALALPAAVDEIWNDGRYPGTRWDGVDDVGYLRAVIEDARAHLPVDATRIYLVGMSNGATMAGRFACQHPDLIAGIGQVAGTAAVQAIGGSRPSEPMPVISIHGSADRFAPYAGGRARGIVARIVLHMRAGPSVGVDDWARFWLAANGAGPAPEITTIGDDVTVRRWRGPSPLADVAFYRIEGGGHTWPGSPSWMPPILGRKIETLDATTTIWEFLSAHARPPAMV